MSKEKGQWAQVVAQMDQLNEFDREPVPPSRFQGPWRFAAFFAGENIAGTKFVIGALLVARGVSFGFICFTQLIEGLVLLASATDEVKYLDTAREILPTLPARGVDHSHGWLSTLRSAVMLYKVTGEESALRFAEAKFAELIASSDYTLWGSVYEYFGWNVQRVWATGDRLTAHFALRERFQTRDGRWLTRAEIGATPVEAALYVSPFLMGVDDTREPLFFSKPWPPNVLHLPKQSEATSSLNLPLAYTHGGFPGTHSVTLRPVAGQLAPAHGTAAVWLTYQSS